MEWIVENTEILFGGIGTAILGYVGNIFFKEKKEAAGVVNINTNSSSSLKQENNNPVKQNNAVIVNISNSDAKKEESLNISKFFKYDSVQEAQNNINILFVDDDTKFKVVNILKSSGWKNTKIVKDVNNLDSSDIKKTDIFFIDIQGVGKKLSFQDEGLGLANALKKKYNEKKVVIYSAETRGDRFHEALRNADDFLSKNAEPFQFQQTIEEFSVNK